MLCFLCRMTYGTEYGIVIVDIVQKVCILNMSSPDLYGSADPYQRVPRSPKRDNNSRELDERCRSPSTDQVCFFFSKLLHVYS
jgi:syntaxin-binding protein 5